jgi:hypothetical protein
MITVAWVVIGCLHCSYGSWRLSLGSVDLNTWLWSAFLV